MIAEKIVIEGPRGYHVVTQAAVVDESKETAASWASEHIVTRPDFGWIVGRFVEADNPNTNGHIFGLEELKDRHRLVVHTPLNMLHRETHITGHFAATELLDGIPATAEEREKVKETAFANVYNPTVEALSAFYRWVFPNEWRYTKQAYDAGMAWYSMEAYPKSVTCAAEGGCGETFPYAGPISDTYCAHMRLPRAPKRLNEPHFVGGAIIIPPTRPGWKNADLTAIAGLIEEELEEAERLYNEVAAAAPTLVPSQWEAVMASLLKMEYGERPAKSRTFGFDRALALLTGDRPTMAPAPPPAVEPPVVDEAPAPMTGGMVALYPDNAGAIADRTAVYLNAEPAAEVHVTLAYVAPVAADLPPEAVAAVHAAARRGAAVRSEPLELTVVGFGTLGQADPPATVCYLQSMAPDANEAGAGAIAEAVRRELDDFGAEAFPPEHDTFIAHMTVGYGVDLEAAKQFLGETFRFSAGVAVVLGAEITYYPWGGE